MCDDKTLWELVDGELPPGRAREIERLADGDAALAARIAEFRELKRAVVAGAPAPPPGFADRVAGLAAARRAAPALDAGEARRFLRRMLVAAAILAACGLAYLAVEVFPVLVREEIYANPLLGR